MSTIQKTYSFITEYTLRVNNKKITLIEFRYMIHKADLCPNHYVASCQKLKVVCNFLIVISNLFFFSFFLFSLGESLEGFFEC